MRLISPNKRHVMLLEVLIAFALVALCIFPLVAPHVFMLKAQYQFNSKIILDQSAARVYAYLLEKAYRNEIPWKGIEQKQLFPLDEELLRAAGLKSNFAYKGTYQLSISRKKGKKERPFTANVINLSIAFEPKESPSTGTEEEKQGQQFLYEYKFFAARMNDEK